MLRLLLLVAVFMGGFASGALPAAQQRCVRAQVVLWGDGKHDDTYALNAWLRGEDAIWADTSAPVGAAINGRVFRLTSAIYVRGGSGRTLRDFRLEWPERHEVVSGGTIAAGTDPDKEPALAGISVVGGDAAEGVPFETPDEATQHPRDEASCATS